ncbi:hypothetical protein BRC89_06250 [Halobacteriales archaeon QS_4_70_19]|nr:MAG: hypothetical protein BRC89_06250 [Halobacteriales archaeon QS_4_70_19]
MFGSGDVSRVSVGPDGSFISAWRAWKRRNHGCGPFVLAYQDTFAFGETDEDGNEYLVRYRGVDGDGLPAGVEGDGVCVRDAREEES